MSGSKKTNQRCMCHLEIATAGKATAAWGSQNKGRHLHLFFREMPEWSKCTTANFWKSGSLLLILAPTSQSRYMSWCPHCQGGAEGWGMVAVLCILFSYWVSAVSPFSKHIPRCCNCPTRFQSFEIVDSDNFFLFNGCFSGGTYPWSFLLPHFLWCHSLLSFKNF